MDVQLYKLRAALTKELVDQAEQGMRMPKPDPFEHGVQAGKWQGIELALQILDDIDRDVEEADARL